MKNLLSIILPLFFYLPATATHLKGGHITYEHKDGFTYAIILTLYTDVDSPVAAGSGILDFGDGSSRELDSEADDIYFVRTRINEGTWRNEIVIDYNYQASGSYTISYRSMYRNEGILNMDNSVNMPFYIESMLIADGAQQNNSIQITRAPRDEAYLHQTYYYNPGARDPEGDSLSFHLIPSMQDKGLPVADYTYPHLSFERDGASESGESAYFTINPTTGEIIWDAPVISGEYSIAYEIREWRLINGQYKQIGSVMHDQQLVVNEAASPGLELIFPVETNTVQLQQDVPWEINIRAQADNPEDTVVLQLSGSLLQQSSLVVNPSDSTGSKGETSIRLSFTPSETADRRYQLIAEAYIYSRHEGPGISRVRSAYLHPPGFVSKVSDLPVRHINVYPNPASGRGFFLDYAHLDGREVSISLFAMDGKMVFHQFFPEFSSKKAVVPGQKLTGYYLAVIRQGKQVYTARILFLD